MERHYFKKTLKEDKFFKFCKENGAEYVEDGEGIWIKPKKSKGADCRAAISYNKQGHYEFGSIEESCLNFRTCDGTKYQETQKWLIETLTMLQNWTPQK